MKVVLVTTPTGKRLVRAKSEKSARDFVIKDTVQTSLVNAADLVDLLASGMVVEDPQTEQEEIVQIDVDAAPVEYQPEDEGEQDGE